jgi:hypothetical protein
MGASAGLGGDTEFAAMLLNQPFCRREPEAGSEILGREQRLEYMRQDIGRNPRSIVDDVDMSLFPGRARPDRDLSLALRAANGLAGICEKIDEHAAEPFIVKHDPGVRRFELEFERHALGKGLFVGDLLYPLS